MGLINGSKKNWIYLLVLVFPGLLIVLFREDEAVRITHIEWTYKKSVYDVRFKATNNTGSSLNRRLLIRALKLNRRPYYKKNDRSLVIAEKIVRITLNPLEKKNFSFENLAMKYQRPPGMVTVFVLPPAKEKGEMP